MPEGDTVHLTARRLHRALAGRLLERTDFRVPGFATSDLSGQRVDACVARGKHLLLRTDAGLTLHSHLKMEGAWHVYRTGERWRGGPAYEIRAILETDAWVAVGYRLSQVRIVPTAEEPALVGHLGPDPLGTDWDAAEAARRIQAEGDRSISDVLLDQRVIAGLGNVYRNELCFLRGLDPWTPTDRAGDARAIADLAAKLLVANRERAWHVTTGDMRQGKRRYVYGREGEPCRRCGTPIRRLDEPSARVTYWCPSCQPARA